MEKINRKLIFKFKLSILCLNLPSPIIQKKKRKKKVTFVIEILFGLHPNLISLNVHFLIICSIIEMNRVLCSQL